MFEHLHEMYHKQGLTGRCNTQSKHISCMFEHLHEIYDKMRLSLSTQFQVVNCTFARGCTFSQESLSHPTWDSEGGAIKPCIRVTLALQPYWSQYSQLPDEYARWLQWTSQVRKIRFKMKIIILVLIQRDL